MTMYDPENEQHQQYLKSHQATLEKIMNPHLFQCGDFTLNSGQKAKWKIECDALTDKDWAGLAQIAATRIKPFGSVLGVPRGGLPFADALWEHRDPMSDLLLIAEDVSTTGGSLERFKALQVELGIDPERTIGVVAFVRGVTPSWVTGLFHLAPELR